MLLAIAFDDPFATLSVDPALQPIEFIQCGLMRLLQFFIRSSCLVEHTFQLGCLPKGSQQETLAFAQVVR